MANRLEDRPGSWAGRTALVALLCFAFFLFSNNAVDMDLWGHVLFGQRMLAGYGIEKQEPFSWTARGQPWINHEVGAEMALGLAHSCLGGTGILLLKLAVGFAAFGIGLRMGLTGGGEKWRLFTLAIAFASVPEIAYGLAARPQIFTLLGLAIELWILRTVWSGRPGAAGWMPVLTLGWVNTHGGVLAGLVVWLAAAVGMTAEYAWVRRGASSFAGGAMERPRLPVFPTVLWMWLGFVLSVAALGVNPWGWKLPVWLVQSVLWNRPIIAEWHPLPLSLDRTGAWILVGLAAVILATGRGRYPFWKALVLVVTGTMACMHVRHTSLFALSALALVPACARESGQRVAGLLSRIEGLGARSKVRWALVIGFGSLAFMSLLAIPLQRKHPDTMEARRSQYPMEAVRFIREHGLKGNLLVFFDWGELCLWELPDCAPSVDGRLDTCYPRAVIAANWACYNGDSVDAAALDLGKADVALLWTRLAGRLRLEQAGWRMLYNDPLAVVYVRDAGAFPGLGGIQLPVVRLPEVLAGSEPFPSVVCRRAERVPGTGAER